VRGFGCRVIDFVEIDIEDMWLEVHEEIKRLRKWTGFSTVTAPTWKDISWGCFHNWASVDKRYPNSARMVSVPSQRMQLCIEQPGG
jgi:hypothetical protein